MAGIMVSSVSSMTMFHGAELLAAELPGKGKGKDAPDKRPGSDRLGVAACERAQSGAVVSIMVRRMGNTARPPKFGLGRINSFLRFLSRLRLSGILSRVLFRVVARNS